MLIIVQHFLRNFEKKGNRGIVTNRGGLSQPGDGNR
jgi:hypothetical protein